MIDHLTLPVSDVDATTRAYARALEPVGYSVQMSLSHQQIPTLPYPKMVGLGARGKPDLWLRPARGAVDGTHVAIAAAHRSEVDAFHAAALAAGMKDDGGPGPRQHYHPNYYGAFVRDADGHSLEVVCHAPPPKPKAAKKPSAPKKSPAKKKKR
jgi:catechol 2,3-dioxygenase-like lactoylglutathione lyase family enzyme